MQRRSAPLLSVASNATASRQAVGAAREQNSGPLLASRVSHNAPAPALHETLLATMMARSTPAALLHSRGGRAAARLLEASFLAIALALAAMLLFLHAKFVRDDGCALLLKSAFADEDLDLQKKPQRQDEIGRVALQDRPKIVEVLPLAPAPLPLLLLLRASGSTSGAGGCTHSGSRSDRCEISKTGRTHAHTDQAVFRFRFAEERGILLLSDRALAELNISIHTILLPPDEHCLGGRWTAGFLENVVGYHAVAANAFLGATMSVSSSPDVSGYSFALPGFLRAYPSKTIINLNHAAAAPARLRLVWKFGALITATFIMCTTGALVSFTLKEVQVRIVKLSIDLQYAMRAPASGRSYVRVLLRYALDALVFVPIVAGVLFFLFEFFDDQLLAFGVLVVSWLAEVAVNGSTRHWVSRSYLPRLFFVYFGAFHFYFFSFPLGFTWLSFTASVALMFHACLAIWNHFELPLMQREAESRSEWT